jgi:hypothetical protein
VIHEEHRLLAIAPLSLAIAASPLPIDARNAEWEARLPFHI